MGYFLLVLFPNVILRHYNVGIIKIFLKFSLSFALLIRHLVSYKNVYQEHCGMSRMLESTQYILDSMTHIYRYAVLTFFSIIELHLLIFYFLKVSFCLCTCATVHIYVCEYIIYINILVEPFCGSLK